MQHTIGPICECVRAKQEYVPDAVSDSAGSDTEPEEEEQAAINKADEQAGAGPAKKVGMRATCGLGFVSQPLCVGSTP